MGESKMIKYLYKFLCVLTSLLILSGCVTKGANMKYLESKTIDDTHPRATLIIGTTELVNKILITNVKVVQAGLLPRAGIDVQNLTDNRYSLEYKIVWRDKQGFANNISNVWHRFVLSPRKIKSFQSMGKTEEAYSIQFTVRFPDDLYIESDRRREQDN
jgi:uncharacterized protein YcfL